MGQMEIVHSLHVLKERRDDGFLSQYILNPSLSSNDWIYLVKATLAIIVIRFLLAGLFTRRVFGKWQSLFQQMFSSSIRPDKKRKFSENLWYSCWHLTSFGWNLYVLYRESVASKEGLGWPALLGRELNAQWYFMPTPAEALSGNPGWPILTVSSSIRLFYLTELAFWLSCLAYIWVETQRDDFRVMLLHHIATLVLIGLSYLCSYWRIGCIVLLCHDFGDIFLYTAKTLHYSKCRAFIVDFLFISFVVAFFISRLIFFPLFCLRPAFDHRSFNEWSKGLVSRVWHVPGGLACVIALCLLQTVHVFWFGLIIRMTLRTLKTKSSVTNDGDIRSDDDDDGEEVEQESLKPTNVGDCVHELRKRPVKVGMSVTDENLRG